jgi:hypothetical protein
MKQEKEVKVGNGYAMILVVLLFIAVTVAGIILFRNPWFLLMIPVILLMMRGFFIVNPNSSNSGLIREPLRITGFSGQIPSTPERRFHCVPGILTVNG